MHRSTPFSSKLIIHTTHTHAHAHTPDRLLCLTDSALLLSLCRTKKSCNNERRTKNLFLLCTGWKFDRILEKIVDVVFVNEQRVKNAVLLTPGGFQPEEFPTRDI